MTIELVFNIFGALKYACPFCDCKIGSIECEKRCPEKCVIDHDRNTIQCEKLESWLKRKRG